MMAIVWKFAILGVLAAIMRLIGIAAFTCKAGMSIGTTISTPIDENCTDNNRIDMCFVSIAGQVNNSVIQRGCQLKGISLSDVCGSSILSIKDGSVAVTCCCNTTSCNDDEFVQKCLHGTLEPPKPLSFACHRELKTTETVVKHQFHVCGSNSTTGASYQNKCMVSITSGTSTSLETGCILNSPIELPCDSKVTLGSSTTQRCCCDTEMCNDDAFVEKCIEKSLLSSPPTITSTLPSIKTTVPTKLSPVTTKRSSFNCVLSVEIESLTLENGTQNCQGSGKSDMCFVSMTSVLNSSSTFRGCQETTVNPKDVCNITIQGADGSVTKTCCCNSSSCNNETFLQQCSNDSLPLPDTFSCHHEVASVGRTVRYAYQDCRVNGTLGQIYNNKCTVTIIQSPEETSVSTGCLSRDIPDLACGQSAQNGDIIISHCCCESKMCNNETFLENCKINVMKKLEKMNKTRNGTVVDNSFKCISSSNIGGFTTRGVEKCEENGNQNVCRVNILKTQNENETIISRNCLASGAIKSEACGVTIKGNDGKKSTFCCCDSPSCNNDQFIERCMQGAVKTPLKADAFGCHRSVISAFSTVTYDHQDCTANETLSGKYKRKCTVTVIKTPQETSISSGCLPMEIPDLSCGQTIQTGDTNISQCCCDSKMCNDKEFIENCKNNVMNTTDKNSKMENETSVSPSFNCISSSKIGPLMTKGIENCQETGKTNVCTVTLIKAQHENETVITRSCLAKGAFKSETCGITITGNDGKISRGCCCDSSSCNNDEFMKQCIEGRAVQTDIKPGTFRCHREIMTDFSNVAYDYQDCAANQIGTGQSFLNKCMVSVIESNGKISLDSGCLPTGPLGSTCGQRIIENNSTITLCCCDGAMCNNRSFVEKCKADNIKRPEKKEEDSFYCNHIEVEGEVTLVNNKKSCKANGLLEKCMTQISYINSTKAIITDCMLKGTDTLCSTVDVNGTTSGFSTAYCCCDDSSGCNDEEFIKKCDLNITKIEEKSSATDVNKVGPKESDSETLNGSNRLGNSNWRHTVIAAMVVLVLMLSF